MSQLVCLAVFLVLFRLTDYTGSDTIPYAVNILFRLDPLVLAVLTLAEKTFVAILWPSLITIGITVLFGRVFCSWVCPLGTLIDMSGHVILPGRTPHQGFRYLKYAILIILMVSALFGVQLLGYADPFAILVRGMVFCLDPILNFFVSAVFDGIYTAGPEWLSNLTELLYSWMKDVVLPYKQSFFGLTFLSFGLLLVIFLLEKAGRRFWCRNLCPLGGLLALISKLSIFKRIPVRACRNCDLCERDCRMDAFEADRSFRTEECNLCMDCLEFCPEQITTFRFALPKGRPSVDISRRQLITAGAAGIVLPLLSRTHAASKLPDDKLIRPPGAQAETDFLAVCVRCGECMKVCINNALQPLFLEKGVEGMFTPHLVPRLGYCEFNCTLCSQVCPTGAIEQLSLLAKHEFVMGTAFVDKNRCLVYAENKSCIVCEEHCPTHDKAIKFNEVRTTDAAGKTVLLKQPYVKEALCVGCGICEYICPVKGSGAIHVTAKGSERPLSFY